MIPWQEFPTVERKITGFLFENRPFWGNSQKIDFPCPVASGKSACAGESPNLASSMPTGWLGPKNHEKAMKMSKSHPPIALLSLTLSLGGSHSIQAQTGKSQTTATKTTSFLWEPKTAASAPAAGNNAG